MLSSNDQPILNVLNIDLPDFEIGCLSPQSIDSKNFTFNYQPIAQLDSNKLNKVYTDENIYAYSISTDQQFQNLFDISYHFSENLHCNASDLESSSYLHTMHRRVARNSQWGAILGVWGRSPQPPKANGGLVFCPQPPEARGFGGGAPSARKFCIFLQK